MRQLLSILFLLVASLVAQAQASGPASVIRFGPSLPANCQPAGPNVFFKTTATTGLYQCTAANTWTLVPLSSSSAGWKPWLPAAGCDDLIATPLWDVPTTNKPTAACVTGTNTQKGVLDFPDTDGDFSVQQTLSLPSSFASIDVKIRWLSAATTGNVVWQAQVSCVADAETDDPAFNAASVVIDAAKGTTLQTNEASIIGVTSTGCVAGELLHLKLLRNRTHASDTIAGVIRLIGVEVTIN